MNFLAGLLSQHVIKIRDGDALCTKGKISSALLAEISSLASSHSVVKGDIWIDGVGRVSFSRHIPEALHQRLRNVIVSR